MMEQTDVTQALTAVFTRVYEALLQYLPSVVAALLLMAAGWIVARILRAITLRLTRLVDALFRRLYTRRGLVESGVPAASSEVIASIVFWLVMLFFAAAATQVLGLSVVMGWFDRLVIYLPTLLAGAAIIIAGMLLGRLANDLLRATVTVPAPHRALLGRAVQTLILVTAIIVGADQIGIRITFLVIMAAVVAATVLGGVALALGLAARDYVANLVAARQLSAMYRSGQQIRISGFEGKVLEINRSALVLETENGRVSIPAQWFLRRPSVLTVAGSGHERD